MENKEECVRQSEQVIQKLRVPKSNLLKRKEAGTEARRREVGDEGKTRCDEMKGGSGQTI